MAEQDKGRKPYFRFHECALSPECVTVNREPGETFKRFNYDLCRAIDMTSLGIVLEKMALAGWIDPREAEIFHTQAGSLLALMRTANNRAHGARTRDRDGPRMAETACNNGLGAEPDQPGSEGHRPNTAVSLPPEGGEG